jgi:hypothetical protein
VKLFVAYPYKIDGYREALAATLASENVELVYADEHLADKHVLHKIEDMLGECDLALFDVTGGNPNVTLELGIAIAAPHPYVVAVNHAALGSLGADIHGWDQLRYGTVKELGSRLADYIRKGRVPARRSPPTPKRARLWVFTEKPASIIGGPSMLTLYPTVSNEGDETANGFMLRLQWSPHRTQRSDLKGWTSAGTFAVPYFERHFDTPVYPGTKVALPPMQIATGPQGFTTSEIGWSIACADGSIPSEDGLFFPLTSFPKSEQNDQAAFKPIAT